MTMLSETERRSRLEILARETWNKWAHLREAFPSVESPGFWGWLCTHGTKEIPGVAELLPSPPPFEIYRFSNTTDEWGWLLTSSSTYEMVCGILADHDLKLRDVGPVLDFGCGPGRGLRCFLRDAGEVELFGTDVDEAAVNWASAAMPFARFETNEEMPPLRYADDQFGLIFAVSVFSHLSEKSHLAWLAELHRVMRPGGVAILTVHGLHAMQRVVSEPAMFKMIEVDRARFEAAREKVESDKGFGYVLQPDGHLTDDLYGVAFMHPDYVQDRWSEHFEILEHRVAAIDDWQDAVVIRAR
jgi:SAM-dependent methyltransferase